MASLSFNLTSTPFTGTKTYQLSDADAQRWLNALSSKLGALRNPDGSVIDNPTNAQLLVAWANTIVSDMKRMTKDAETAPPADIGIS